MNILKSIRPLNLLIIGVSQFLIYYIVIDACLIAANIKPLLNTFLFALLVIDTMLIAAAAYLVNDIFDVQTDKFNQKTKESFDLDGAKIWFLIISVLALCLAIYIAYSIGNLPLSFLAILAICLLVLYSAYFQKKVLIGNFIVSLFIAFVTGIVWFAEREAYNQLANKNEELYIYLTVLLAAYMIFSFVANMYREIVKDIEDSPGDKEANYNTIAVSWGVGRAKIVALFYGIFLLILEIIWFAYNPLLLQNHLNILFLILIIAPTAYSIFQTYKAKSVKDFHTNSSMIKLIMAMGLVYLILINIL